MSVEYAIVINKDIINNFEKHLELWKNAAFPDLVIKKTDDNKRFFVFKSGSVRGISITLENTSLRGKMNMRLNAFSSLNDWTLLYSFLEYLGDGTKIKVIEEGKTIANRDFCKEHFLNRGQQELDFNMKLLHALFEKDEYINLPIWDVDVVIYKNYYLSIKEREDFVNTLFEYLQMKANLYVNASRANIIETKSKKTVVVWNYDNAIIPKTDYVALFDPTIEKDSPVFVRFDDMLSTMNLEFDAIPIKDAQYYYCFYQSNVDNARQIYDSLERKSISANEI